jgi:hypothetical protein
VELSGTIGQISVSSNEVTRAGFCGIGGWYYLSLERSTISDNHVEQTGELLAFNRDGGLRAASSDPMTLRPADTAVLFRDNVFERNKYSNPTGYSYWGLLESSDIPVYDSLDYVDYPPGDRIPQPSDYLISNNKLTANDFGVDRPAPNFGTNPIVPGMIVDGGGNRCAQPKSAYPLSCSP